MMRKETKVRYLINLAALVLVSGGIAIANYVREGKDSAKQA